MKIEVISVGKVKQPFVLEGEREYLKRLAPWTKLKIGELSADKFNKLPEPQMKEKEGELFLSAVEGIEVLVVLDEGGKQKSSAELAKFFRDKMNDGVGSITFGIGGAYGWDDKVRKKADLVISLSSLTFPYQLCRLILVEQIYRAFSIIKGVPYHKA